MAETYGVLSWRSLPVPLAATLAAGLGDKSRTAKAIRQKPDDTTLMLAMVVDSLQALLYRLFGGTKPTSIYDAISAPQKPPEATTANADDYMSFYTSEDFETMWEQIGGGKHG